jgi:hypothetical protein
MLIFSNAINWGMLSTFTLFFIHCTVVERV